MNEFIKLLLSLSLSGTLLLLLTFLLKQFYKNKFSKCWQYYIWLVVLLRFLFPLTSDTTIVGTLFTVFENITAADTTATEDMPVTAEMPMNRNVDSAVTDASEDVCRYIFFIWSATALAFLTQKITAYQSFIRYIRAGSTEISDLGTLNLLAGCGDKLGIRKPPELYSNPLVSSPLMIGLIRPAVILPAGQNNKNELPYIFTHELIHYKRRDMFYKWLVQMAVCIHWFNPFIYLLEKEINKSCELSCDEAVITSLGDTAKKAYGDTLLSSLKTGNAYRSSLASVTLTEGAEQIKERLGAIMNFKKKSKKTTVIAMSIATIICICFAAAGAYAVSFDKESSLPDDNATAVYATGYVNADALKGRSAASGSADVTALFQKAQEVNILSEENGFYRISIPENETTYEGYVRKEYIDIETLMD